MVVLAAINCTPEHQGVTDYLSGWRSKGYDEIRQRLERGIADGDVPAGTDTAAIAAFYLAVLHGMSIEARDGWSREAMESIAESAIQAWDGLVANSVGALEWPSVSRHFRPDCVNAPKRADQVRRRTR